MFRILVAEDHFHTQKLIESILKDDGYEVVCASDGRKALAILEETAFDCLVLDIMMPFIDGVTLTQTLRDAKDMTPILLLTAKQLPEDKKAGFLAGCDDYLVKPFDNDELLLRIKALLRRSNKLSLKQIRIGDLLVDYNSLSLSKHDMTLTLPQKEFMLLYFLLSQPERIFTRLELINEVWEGKEDVSDATINVHINHLRKKLESFPEIELVTIRSLGYKAVIQSE